VASGTSSGGALEPGPSGTRLGGGVNPDQALLRNAGTCRPDAKGLSRKADQGQAGGPRESQSTDAGHRGGAARSRGEGPVMGWAEGAAVSCRGRRQPVTGEAA